MTTLSATHIVSSPRKLMTLLTAAVILLAVAFASAGSVAQANSVNFNARCATGFSKAGVCKSITVVASNVTVLKTRVGTVCLLGNCKSSSINLGPDDGGMPGRRFIASFLGVGPYRCGAPTSVRLIYGGRTYGGSPRLIC